MLPALPRPLLGAAQDDADGTATRESRCLCGVQKGLEGLFPPHGASCTFWVIPPKNPTNSPYSISKATGCSGAPGRSRDVTCSSTASSLPSAGRTCVGKQTSNLTPPRHSVLQDVSVYTIRCLSADCFLHVHKTAEHHGNPDCIWNSNNKRRTETQLNYSSGAFALQGLLALQRLAAKVQQNHPVLHSTT